jgi:prepilin-type N-terminal cleavage/methylation domain-containing protein
MNKLQIKNKNFKTNIGLSARAGFTLVELLIAVSLFVVIVTVSIGAIVSIFDANRKAQSSKTVVDNLNLSIENMARTIRFGGDYYCGISSSGTNNCPLTPDSSLSVTFGGKRIIYTLDGSAIKRSDDGGPYIAITSQDTYIDYMKFYVLNAGTSNTKQPYVIAVIKGHVSNKPTVQTIFSIETLMSQRTLDL